MATFEAQVEGLTSLTISSSGTAPTQAELTQFLTDGASEVINSMPRKLKLLCATEDTFTSAAVGSEPETLKSGQVLSVTRSDGTIEQPCREIPAILRGRVSDTDEMNAATTSDPAYYIYNGKLNAIPTSGSCKYLEVNRPTVGYGDDSMDDSLTAFPLEYEYLIPLYAAMKALQNAMGHKSSLLPSDIALPSVPSAPTINTISYTDASNEDAFIVDVISVPAKIDVSSNAPAFTKPNIALALGEVGRHLFDEDIELASVRLQAVQAQVSEHNANLQSEQAEFSKENIRYQMEFQEESTKVNQDLQAELERFRTQADIAKFNKQQDQVLNLANASKQVEDLMADNNSKLQKYTNQLQSYKAETSSSIQNYSAKIQKQVTDYQWLVGRYQSLLADYQRGMQLLKGG